jgi:hypothetical protein
MLTISKPVGRGRNGDEDIVDKDSGLLIALVCDRTLQSITLAQISSSSHHQKSGRASYGSYATLLIKDVVY